MGLWRICWSVRALVQFESITLLTPVFRYAIMPA
jgi:hypothetical protein